MSPVRNVWLGSGFAALEARAVPAALGVSQQNISLLSDTPVTGPYLEPGKVYTVTVEGTGQIARGTERTGADAEYVRWGASGADGRDVSVAPVQKCGGPTK